VNSEEKIKATYKEVTENSDVSVEKFEGGVEKINYDTVEKSRSQSKKFDAIDV